MADNQYDPQFPTRVLNKQAKRLVNGILLDDDGTEINDRIIGDGNAACFVHLENDVEVYNPVPVSNNQAVYGCGRNLLARSVLGPLEIILTPSIGFNFIGSETIRAHDFDFSAGVADERQSDFSETLLGTDFSYEFTVPADTYEAFIGYTIKTGAIGDGTIIVDVDALQGAQWRNLTRVVTDFVPSTTITYQPLKYVCLEPTGLPAKPTKYRFRIHHKDGLSFNLLGNIGGEPYIKTNTHTMTRYNLARRVEVEWPIEFGKSPLIPAGNYFDFTGVTMSATKGYRDNYRDLVITSVHLDQNTSITADLEILVDGVVEYTLNITGTQAQAQTTISVPKGDIVALRSKSGSGVMQGPVAILTFRLEDEA